MYSRDVRGVYVISLLVCDIYVAVSSLRYHVVTVVSDVISTGAVLADKNTRPPPNSLPLKMAATNLRKSEVSGHR